MKEVQLDDVFPDSILAADLMAETGSMILGRGTKLSEPILNRLRKMGIESMMVEWVDSEELVAKKKDLLEALENRFSSAPDSAYMWELKRVAMEHVST